MELRLTPGMLYRLDLKNGYFSAPRKNPYNITLSITLHVKHAALSSISLVG